MKNNKKIKNINEYRKVKKNKHKDRKQKKIKKEIVVLLFMVSVSIIVINLCGYSKISQLKYEIHYLKKDLRQKEVILEQLKSELYAKTSTEQIEQDAKEKLNMDYPKENQINYIDVDS